MPAGGLIGGHLVKPAEGRSISAPEEMVTINRLAEIIMQIARKDINLKHIKGPLGVRGRNSDHRFDREAQRAPSLLTIINLATKAAIKLRLDLRNREAATRPF